MATHIRLTRMGAKKKPHYRIVVIDSLKARDGKEVERLGFYNPMTDPADVSIKEDLAIKWLKVGAIPSATVRNIFRKAGIYTRLEEAAKAATVTA